MPYIEHIQFSF